MIVISVLATLTVSDYDGSALYWAGPGAGFSGTQGSYVTPVGSSTNT